ncbi:hypothetical protein RHGRI_016281 [Rhododendron griersonianum]|uniref:BHLH domain-containing protein n=1 Tax=Rhododendron griersonianum TaxID=479676 RepID=A0AAV6JTL6_9ERIC|nr:hypothetical protein RHGRI_016281 [Rhododendron griersonianum]
MADLYNANLHSSPLESEEMTSFLHNLLHKHPFSSPPQPPPAATGLVGRSSVFADSDGRFGERDSVMVDSSAGINFSDPGRGFMADARAVYGGDSDGITSMFKRKFSEESDFDEFGSDFTGPEASEAPVNPALPRSSKRTRAAEVHNLSEKRRRSRINEKMKALQKLIPNSNKTDKASMLDEVIEYLKQLQLQVQMLSMRNGLSLHPLCFPESLHSALMPQPVLSFDEGNEVLNSNRGQDTFSRNQEISVQAAYDFPNQAPMTNINNSETSYGLEPSMQSHYGPFRHHSKELCREDGLSQLQLDMSCSVKNSSSGVSS